MGNHFSHELLLLNILSNFSLPVPSPKVYVYKYTFDIYNMYGTCQHSLHCFLRKDYLGVCLSTSFYFLLVYRLHIALQPDCGGCLLRCFVVCLQWWILFCKICRLGVSKLASSINMIKFHDNHKNKDFNKP